jgi:hypothetical protein
VHKTVLLSVCGSARPLHSTLWVALVKSALCLLHFLCCWFCSSQSPAAQAAATSLCMLLGVCCVGQQAPGPTSNTHNPARQQPLCGRCMLCGQACRSWLVLPAVAAVTRQLLLLPFPSALTARCMCSCCCRRPVSLSLCLPRRWHACVCHAADWMAYPVCWLVFVGLCVPASAKKRHPTGPVVWLDRACLYAQLVYTNTCVVPVQAVCGLCPRIEPPAGTLTPASAAFDGRHLPPDCMQSRGPLQQP